MDGYSTDEDERSLERAFEQGLEDAFATDGATSGQHDRLAEALAGGDHDGGHDDDDDDLFGDDGDSEQNPSPPASQSVVLTRSNSESASSSSNSRASSTLILPSGNASRAMSTSLNDPTLAPSRPASVMGHTQSVRAEASRDASHVGGSHPEMRRGPSPSCPFPTGPYAQEDDFSAFLQSLTSPPASAPAQTPSASRSRSMPENKPAKKPSGAHYRKLRIEREAKWREINERKARGEYVDPSEYPPAPRPKMTKRKPKEPPPVIWNISHRTLLSPAPGSTTSASDREASPAVTPSVHSTPEAAPPADEQQSPVMSNAPADMSGGSPAPPSEASPQPSANTNAAPTSEADDTTPTGRKRRRQDSNEKPPRKTKKVAAPPTASEITEELFRMLHSETRVLDVSSASRLRPILVATQTLSRVASQLPGGTQDDRQVWSILGGMADVGSAADTTIVATCMSLAAHKPRPRRRDKRAELVQQSAKSLAAMHGWVEKNPGDTAAGAAPTSASSVQAAGATGATAGASSAPAAAPMSPGMFPDIFAPTTQTTSAPPSTDSSQEATAPWADQQGPHAGLSDAEMMDALLREALQLEMRPLGDGQQPSASSSQSQPSPFEGVPTATITSTAETSGEATPVPASTMASTATTAPAQGPPAGAVALPWTLPQAPTQPQTRVTPTPHVSLSLDSNDPNPRTIRRPPRIALEKAPRPSNSNTADAGTATSTATPAAAEQPTSDTGSAPSVSVANGEKDPVPPPSSSSMSGKAVTMTVTTAPGTPASQDSGIASTSVDKGAAPAPALAVHAPSAPEGSAARLPAPAPPSAPSQPPKPQTYPHTQPVRDLLALRRKQIQDGMAAAKVELNELVIEGDVLRNAGRVIEERILELEQARAGRALQAEGGEGAR